LLRALFLGFKSAVADNRPRAWIDPGQRIESVIFHHPCYTFDSLSTHKELDNINGKDRIFYCGAYCGYGFHEDGARSGVTVAQKFGIDL